MKRVERVERVEKGSSDRDSFCAEGAQKEEER